MSQKPSAWNELIQEWVERERKLHPDAPIRADSVSVRDVLEVDDSAFVLVSYDVDYPWPTEEDTPGDPRSANTAVLQALRVRSPWIERDSVRALSRFRSEDGKVALNEHPLGPRHAYSGQVEGKGVDKVTLRFDGGDSCEATVVDGWFLAVVHDRMRVHAVEATKGGTLVWEAEPQQEDIDGLIDQVDFTRHGQSMYFSPLDLRTVIPLGQWERNDKLVVVAVSLERYDSGGILRLRMDGVRSDDDLFVSWPKVALKVQGQPLASSVVGETAAADTVALDVGFGPWIPDGADSVNVSVMGLRGLGHVGDVTFDIRLP